MTETAASTTSLRYVQVAPIGEDASAIRAFSGRWFRLPLPYPQAVELLGTLPVSDHTALAPAAQQIRAMLIDGGSAVPRTPAADRGEAMTTGAGALRDAIVMAGTALAALPVASIGRPQSLTGARIVLLHAGSYEDASSTESVEAFHRAGVAVLPLVAFDGRAWLGPLLPPDGPLTLTDVGNRLAANAEVWPGTTATEVRRLGTGFSTAELSWIAAIAEVELQRYVAGEPGITELHLIELDPTALSTTRHPVIPWPIGEGRPPLLPGTFSIDALVDPRTGVVNNTKRFIHHADVPRRLISVHAHVSHMRRLCPWKTDAATAGTSFDSEDLARAAAIGEAAERYCGNIIQPELLRTGSWNEIVDGGEHALDPQELVLFSDAQYASPGFPFTRFTRDLDTHWVRGRSLTRDRDAWLPASLSYGNWYNGDYEGTPPMSNLYFAGLAAGPDLDFAIVSALQEIVERHATMVWWANAQPLPSIREFPAEMAALWDGAPTEAGQRAWLVPLPNEFGIPVMAGIVEHTADRLFTAGFAARSDPRQAALKAWAEALTLQDGARNLDRPNGGYRQAIARGEVPGAFLADWREDRRYLDDYRPDFRDVVDLMAQLQIYLDPRATERVRPWVDTPAGLRLENIAPMPDGTLRGYAETFASRGYEIFYADLTTPDVASTGMRVVRVFVPGLVGNFSAAFPYQGKGRLRDAAVELGWRTQPLGEDEINTFPLPHA
jgi:ribosomal protein S12 methylthiotransferase accessory factor